MSEWSLATLLASLHDDIQRRLTTAREAFKLTPSHYDAAVVDYRLPDATGLSLLWKWGSMAAVTPVIEMADSSTVPESL